jgi:hypothetical protein
MKDPFPTDITVRVISCDAKVIGSLVGGCRVVIRHRLSQEVLAEGYHRGGSGDTESIMKQPHQRGATVFGTESAAAFTASLPLTEPTPVEIIAEGPLAYPQALQRASMTTWLIPGENVPGEGFILQLHGFIVEVMSPASVEVFGPHDPVHLEASVRLL